MLDNGGEVGLVIDFVLTSGGVGVTGCWAVCFCCREDTGDLCVVLFVVVSFPEGTFVPWRRPFVVVLFLGATTVGVPAGIAKEGDKEADFWSGVTLLARIKRPVSGGQLK